MIPMNPYGVIGSGIGVVVATGVLAAIDAKLSTYGHTNVWRVAAIAAVVAPQFVFLYSAFATEEPASTSYLPPPPIRQQVAPRTPSQLEALVDNVISKVAV